MNGRLKPVIAVTMGDPAGVGPEIAVKALLRPEVRSACRAFVVGSRWVFEKAIQDCGFGSAVAGRVCDAGDPIPVDWNPDGLPVLDVDGINPDRFAYGRVAVECGRVAGESIRRAVSLVLAAKADAIATAPINKEAFKAAGFAYPGHTEMLAALSGGGEPFLMLAIGGFRVVHATLHLPLSQVPSVLTADKVFKAIQVTANGLKGMGVASARVGVAGLNPHAGEGGLFGNEDQAVIRPAVERAREQGIRAEGPISGDTVFAMLRGGAFDAVVAMYHDQGGIPMKLLSFTWDAAAGRWSEIRGVNVTLGLPIIRTSVAHGTGFEVAGRGVASEQSLVDAIMLAAQMVETRKSAAGAGRAR